MTTKTYNLRTPEEAKTHELFAWGDNGVEWSSDKQVIALVFKAQYHAALPVEKIQLLGAVLAGYDHTCLDPEWLTADLTKLVRAKILRSHRQHGRTLYEVNY